MYIHNHQPCVYIYMHQLYIYKSMCIYIYTHDYIYMLSGIEHVKLLKLVLNIKLKKKDSHIFVGPPKDSQVGEHNVNNSGALYIYHPLPIVFIRFFRTNF